jgi:hypothetical protein|tara:strand:+ start:805 stop:1320 length:516 start_codon:yes stop_codon:yes gene_type:complete
MGSVDFMKNKLTGCLYMDKQYFAINLPSTNWDDASPLQEVEHWQPLKRRLLVEKLARYFKREGHYDFIPYLASEPHKKNVVFLWLGEHMDWDSSKAVAYGAIEFEPCNYTNLIEKGCEWQLAWVWFHPYMRNRGHLSAAWDYFLERFGNFWVTRPLSSDMKKFLETHASMN